MGSVSYCIGIFVIISGGIVIGFGCVVWYNFFIGYSKILINGDIFDFFSYGFNGFVLNNVVVDLDIGNIYWIDCGNDNVSISIC